MSKQIIFFLLLITNTLAYGMKRQATPNIFLDNQRNIDSVLLDKDLLWQVTAGLCSVHKHRPRYTKIDNGIEKKSGIKRDIATLSTTNKFFRDYYNKTAVKQSIIRLCSERLNSNDRYITHTFGCRVIEEKIEYFTDIALRGEKEFTAEDLKEEWYLTMNTNVFNAFLTLQQSLLQVTINHSKVKKVNDILNATKEFNFRYNTAENILYQIVEKRACAKESGMIAFPTITFSCTDNEHLEGLLSIARRLLEETKILVDGRMEDTQKTALMQAIIKRDKPFVRLLLEFNADPTLTAYDVFSNKVPAFDFEPYEGWLQAIIDDVTKEKQTKAVTL